jgi:hypothetical protein
MNSSPSSFRNASPQQLAQSLRHARDYTLLLFDCFAAAGMDVPARVPQLRIINPPLWELGHLAWFAEWFILREATSSHPADGNGNCLLTRGDDWFDSALVPHRTRWTLDLPSTGALKTYCREVLDRVLDKLSREPNTDAALYPYRLALAHEDMHGEALLYTLQTLGLPAPATASALRPALYAPSEISFPGGTIQMGSDGAGGFVFDNERAAHACHVAPFAIDSGLVTNAQYADFVGDGGYDNRQFWRCRRRLADAPGALGAAPLAARRRPVAHRAFRRADHAGGRRAGTPFDAVRGAGLLRLGRTPPAERGGVGVRGAVRSPGVSLGAVVGMDVDAIRALSGFRAGPLPRILAAVVHHPSEFARGLVRDPASHGQRQIPQLLHARARRHVCRPAHLRVGALRRRAV